MRLQLKLSEKVQKAGKRAFYAWIVVFLTVIFFVIAFIKGLYFFSYNSTTIIFSKINNGIEALIESTSFFPFGFFWKYIPAVPLLGNDDIQFFKMLISLMIVFLICGLFIVDHRILKSKRRALLAKIEDEKDEQDLRKEKGLKTVSEKAIVDIIVSNPTNNDPAWHEKWWGKVIMAVAIAIILALIGLK